MQYISTRDSARSVNAAQAIISGLSPDGGLFLPESVPVLERSDFLALLEMDYTHRAAFVLSRLLDSYTEEELLAYCEAAYAKVRFSERAAPVKHIGNNENILELFHGPTCAFKDFALQILPYLLTGALKKEQVDKTVAILVATSGDTGKAALEGFSDVAGTKICVFYPDGAISNIQKLQMTTQDGDNVMVAAVRGNFDDAQNGVKKIFTDDAYKAELLNANTILSSANSINWGRLAPQIAYYISAYLDLINAKRIALFDPINITVPTGNFGNILAAYYAMRMGVPVNKFICASNRNSVLTDFITTGTYDKNRDFFVTSSPSMDILISSNLERLLYLLVGSDDKKVGELMASLAKDGRYTLPEDALSKLQAKFYAGFADDEQTARTIRDVFSERKYLCDPHTAVGIKVYRDYVKESGDTTPCVIASTASPFKFSKSVLDALRISAPGDDFEMLEKLSEVSGVPAPQRLTELRGKRERFSSVADRDELKNVVSEFLL